MFGEIAGAPVSALGRRTPSVGASAANENELAASDGLAVACAKSGTAGDAGFFHDSVGRRVNSASCTRGFSNWKPAIPFEAGMEELLTWLEGQEAADSVDAAREALVSRGLAR